MDGPMGVPLSLGSLGEECLNTRLVEFSGGGAGCPAGRGRGVDAGYAVC